MSYAFLQRLCGDIETRAENFPLIGADGIGGTIAAGGPGIMREEIALKIEC
jgi:hypothetical protein